MHFEVLVEDASGKAALEILLPKLIGKGHTNRVIPYRGIGKIPMELKSPKNAAHRILLDNLPKLLRGYGKTYAKSNGSDIAIVIVCDLDDRCLKEFRAELLAVKRQCSPKLNAHFCLAVEEGEAWFLGDVAAIQKAYPKTKQSIVKRYQNDSICGTWETLADAVFLGGSKKLKLKGWQAIGIEKSRWAKNISPHINFDLNLSPSFQYFCRKIRFLTGVE